ncbi:protein NDR1-like [Apium graveolens]|uniref:protein NDR1-like n=1 Tax=Apium graveolens TaxID=4045 RepID=UPI003D78B36E
MSDGANRSCCNFCCTFIFTSGLTALFLWLSLRASNPTCSIQRFDVPALNKTANSTSNHTIYFDLKLDNQNKDKGIYYDTLNLTFSYGVNKSQPIGNFTVHSFYQGHRKSTHRKTLVDLYNVSFEAVSVSKFRVDLETAVRFKIMGFKTKRHKIVVWAQVDVNESGQKANKKGIKLKSGAPEFQRYRERGLLFLVVFSTTLVLLSIF